MSANGRTPEQVAADQKLTEAIENSLEAYGFAGGDILTDYMVISAQVAIDDDGDQSTAYCYLYRDSDLPYHRILGLLEIARIRAAYNMNKEY